MPRWIPCLVLLFAAIPASAGEEEEALRFIAQQVDDGEMPEKEALDFFQQLIDDAKKRVEAHKPPDPEKLECLLSAANLDATTNAISSGGCTVEALEPVALMRKDNQVTVKIGNQGRAGSRTFSLKSGEEADKRFQTLFAEWQAIATKIANAPPEDKWLSQCSPHDLLKRGRDVRGLIGGSGFSVTSFVLKDPDEELAFHDQTGVCKSELKKWHGEMTKLVVPVKDPAAKAGPGK